MVVNILRNIGFNICIIGFVLVKDFILGKFFLLGVLGSYFIGVERFYNFKVFLCDKIIVRVIFVRSDDVGVNGYIFVVLKSY